MTQKDPTKDNFDPEIADGGTGNGHPNIHNTDSDKKVAQGLQALRDQNQTLKRIVVGLVLALGLTIGGLAAMAGLAARGHNCIEAEGESVVVGLSTQRETSEEASTATATATIKDAAPPVAGNSDSVSEASPSANEGSNHHQKSDLDFSGIVNSSPEKANDPEVKAEDKAEVKDEVKAEVKDEIKDEVKPEVKDEVKDEVKAPVNSDPPFGSTSYITSGGDMNLNNISNEEAQNLLNMFGSATSP